VENSCIVRLTIHTHIHTHTHRNSPINGSFITLVRYSIVNELSTVEEVHLFTLPISWAAVVNTCHVTVVLSAHLSSHWSEFANVTFPCLMKLSLTSDDDYFFFPFFSLDLKPPIKKVKLSLCFFFKLSTTP
jgi:hypothetical protein